MINLGLVRLLIDFGLLILIWMVQLIVYPGFLYYTRERLILWHKKYTPSIAVIVGPLMISQLGIAFYQLLIDLSFINVGHFTLVVIVWIITFVFFVPLHKKIDEGHFHESVPKKLVRTNWYRTILWTLTFIASLVNIIID